MRENGRRTSFWSDKYIQHSAHIEPGREGLFRLIRSLPDTLRYEHGHILAEDDYVIVHGRFSGTGLPRASVAADVVRIENGVLAEHWDVLEDEVTQAESKSGLPGCRLVITRWRYATIYALTRARGTRMPRSVM
jgi:predicted SnoaL-like aldol condensation-catalyzing enzyme